MVAWVDVAIPGLVGLWLALRPRSAISRRRGEPTPEKLRLVRVCGAVLLAVAAGYTVIRLTQPR